MVARSRIAGLSIFIARADRERGFDRRRTGRCDRWRCLSRHGSGGDHARGVDDLAAPPVGPDRGTVALGDDVPRKNATSHAAGTHDRQRAGRKETACRWVRSGPLRWRCRQWCVARVQRAGRRRSADPGDRRQWQRQVHLAGTGSAHGRTRPGEGAESMVATSHASPSVRCAGRSPWSPTICRCCEATCA